ncbi:MAG: hypothetical protein A2992_06550 [Elusimicrobia bacterium RIFCSPLOWO2_01_FULL_59_12]|nr:MAG: hypothetical protein A2992_06550 [Elusimicrobia bacterium RIFCSPLOWO2_01_FULL_59_12]
MASGFLCQFFITPVYGGQEQKPFIQAARVEAIYHHLVKNHWVPETGLFISFFGTQDRKLVQQASTYDQAAAGILALRLGDIERARGIFHFFRSAWLEGPLKSGREGVSGLANFYNAEFGGDGIEKTIHMGPNAWAGLFAATLGNVTQDKEATEWALKVAHWAAQDLAHSGGAVAMGPMHGADDVPWPKIYSTENNLSYYALLAELLRAPALEAADRQWLEAEKNNLEDWLVTTAFDRLAYTMNRGMNPDGVDRIRALDTITWLISALGPERLNARGIDPDRLMLQAQESFEVSVNGLAGVDPTDQPEADLTFTLITEEVIPRGAAPRTAENGHRMIWYEGLGQYINALNTMAHYSEQAGRPEKALAYTEKALLLTEQFDQAALPNHAAGAAYAYATDGKFFHDGWYPPMDAADGPASSLISAVWRCYAGLGIDPLAGKDIAGVPAVDISAPKIARVNRPRPSVLYGASDDMVIQAWQHLQQGDTDRAIQQAQATIAEWSEWALKLQEKKARKVGHLVEYSGLPEQRKEIFSYWALNDVAAAHFILGKAFDQKRHHPQAAGAFQQIVQNYSLAQIWDPRGWFWSPVTSIGEEFVSADPRHYGDILPQMLAASPNIGNQPF